MKIKLLTIFFIGFIFSCKGPLDNIDNNSITKEGKLKIVWGNNTRTLTPLFNDQVMKYRIEIKKGGVDLDTHTTELSYEIITLNIGSDYNLRIVGLDSNDIVLMEQATDFSIIADTTTTLGMILEPLTVGTGSVGVNLNWPNSIIVDSVSVSWQGEDSELFDDIIEDGNVDQVTFVNNSASIGSSLLVVKFSLDDEVISVVTESVHVYPNFTTSGDIGLSEGDFSSAPVAPLNLSGISTASSISLTWDDESNTETSFILENSTDNVIFETLTTTSANAESFVDTGLTLNTEYYYRVCSKNSFGQSSWLNLSTSTLEKEPIGDKHPASGIYSPVSEETWSIADFALGAEYASGVGSDLTFALFSSNATKVLLEIYDTTTGNIAVYDYWMSKGTDNIWRAEIQNPGEGVLYGFRLWGPNWNWDVNWDRGNSSLGFISDVDSSGNRFNPNKVVYDPYAKELSHDKETPALLAAGENGGIFGTGGVNVDSGQTYSGPITENISIDRRDVDTGIWAIKAVAFNDNSDYGTKPNIPEAAGIIYEAHVRGITKHPSSLQLGTIVNGIPGFESVANVPAAYQGTYKGAAYIAPYLKALGYTTIELLPVHETANDINPDDSSGGNYWGYMTYGFFAPDRRYSYDKSLGGPTKEFKEMIKAFHDNGLEVYLDVVYNHTGEGGTWDGTGAAAEITSFRGIDNSSYYALVDGSPHYWQSTGCGNNFDASTDVVKNLIKDSLEYWITEMGADGFRFDLAPVLGRDSYPDYNYNPSAQLLKDIADMTTVHNVEMVAEAWDIGAYSVGSFPEKWGEWNGHYRDQVRRFMKGDANTGDFTNVFNGDYDSFNDQGGPHKSVNFLVAHDGFTLADLVSYNDKNNTSVSWPFGPSDGGNDDNDSWNSNSDQALRRQRIRNFWVIQMMSRGIPMTVWGDEFSRTQNGNNNPYNIDSVATWSNYDMIASDSPQNVSTGDGGGYHNNVGTDDKADSLNNLFLFSSKVVNMRKSDPILSQSDYTLGYSYHKADYSNDASGDDRAVLIHIDGSEKGGGDYLVFVNMWEGDIDFKIPIPDTGRKWLLVVNTANWAEDTDNFWDAGDADVYIPTGFDEWNNTGKSYGVKAWSVVVFHSIPE